ncbi:MAG: hypothetical protein D6718_05785, partial [Acidobacteria bacterium]
MIPGRCEPGESAAAGIRRSRCDVFACRSSPPQRRRGWGAVSNYPVIRDAAGPWDDQVTDSFYDKAY